MLERLKPTRIGALVAAILVAFLAVVAPAQADDDQADISSMLITGALQSDGSLKLQMKLTMEFDGQHGPYLVFGQDTELDEDPNHYQHVELKIDGVQSSTGAPAGYQTENEDRATIVKIGDEGQTIDGTHEYTIDYRLTGIVRPAGSYDGAPNKDVVDWRAIAPGGFEVPIPVFRADIDLTAKPEAVVCYAGSANSTDVCNSFQMNGTVAEMPAFLSAKEGIRLIAEFPAGTFPDAKLELAKRPTWSNVWGLTPITGGGSALALAGGLAGILAYARKQRRDERYLDLPPGVAAISGAQPKGRVPTPEIPVSFTPLTQPAGMLGTLTDGSADEPDVVATTLDLARRGFISIEKRERKNKDDDYVLHRLEPESGGAELKDFEKTFLDTVFDSDSSVRISKVGEELASASGTLKSDLDAAVVEAGWYRTSPTLARGVWGAIGAVLFVLGVVWIPLSLWFHWPMLIAIVFLVLGLAVLLNSDAAPVRTAEGSVINDQLEGFKKYVMAAEAGQLTVSEAAGYYEPLLPLAVALGLETEWENACRKAMIATGSDLTMPYWYLPGMTAHSFSSAISDAMSSSISAVSSSSGGGVSGGGGSMGGGSW
ncbi:hypothetical protein BSZ39_06930 [Bowdeniella nasicola]|uniref:DUF2207 domain-containing protein n=1 Tax=Bowdeniella nasicola TaxID=208480 RepID=A0A1Q5Q236_9ACTO|nr:DUF2207 domain-containing protein [Bowdeniella nasicola]OKL53923.1 hypothetical protein BSZ39_06930 [Bowdeniella nasicola]